HVVQNLQKFHPELVQKKFYPEILNASFLSKMKLISSKPVAPPQEFSVRLEDRLYIDGYPVISEADAEHVIQDYLEVLRGEGFTVDRNLLAQKRVKVEQSMAEQRTKKKHEESATKAAEEVSKEPVVVEVSSSSEETESEDETESDEETLA
ncbi:hypothetical protein L195_g059369, partial [Trifolium pratense]